MMAALALALPGVASARVPQAYVGVMLDGPMWPTLPGINLTHQFNVMVASGVESVRWQIDWANTQPYQSWSDVPASQHSHFTDVDGLPLDLRALDRFVLLAAQRGIVMRPVVEDAPNWDAVPSGTGARAPRDDGAFGTFLTALIHRYGPHGSFWATHSPRLPIRAWQIWNEPNLIGYWPVQPNWAPSFMQMFKVAHDAIKQADPGATVILAGLVNDSWTALKQVYEVPGARSLFDVAADHPYTHLPSGVATIVERFRAVMAHYGDRNKPLLIDEFGWNSCINQSPYHFGIEVNQAQQAKYTGEALHSLFALRGRLHLMAIDYNDWAGVETPGSYEFNWAGLFRVVHSRLVAKPVYGVFRRDVLAAEHCRRKSGVATRCARSG